LSFIVAILLARRIASAVGEVSRVVGKFTRFEIDDIEPLPPSRVKEIKMERNHQKMKRHSSTPGAETIF